MNTLSNYLVILHKLRDISDYIKTIDNNLNPTLVDSINQCKSSCINELKLFPEIISLLDEINKEHPAVEFNNDNDLELKNQIDSLANVITSTINTTDDEKLSIDSFETLGTGLARLFKASSPSSPSQNLTPLQIKNELNDINSNINFAIRRK